MSPRRALNRDLIMRRVSGHRHRGHAATSSTSSITDSHADNHSPHESDDAVQTSSALFSDMFSRVEAGFTHLRTVTHDPNIRLATISAVDKEVDATRQLLCSLLTRRNTLVPISLLPPEILVRVFHLLALEEPPYSDKRNVGWIKTTHVCRHWRQVALGDSSLWANISGVLTNNNPALISEMLARARNALLEIDIDLFDTKSLDIFHMIPPHLSHTRSLRLHNLSSAFHLANVRELFSQEAPALEHFELGVCIALPITFRDLDATTLFKGQALKLRSFCISQVCVPWSSIPHGQLTQLKISFVDETSAGDAHSPGDARQFIDLLVNCPALEILVLELCLPSGLSQFSRGRTVHLPHLSRLCVGGSSSRVTSLLKMLKLHSTTTLHLRCTSEAGSLNNDYHILPVISAQLQTSVPFEFKSLKVGLGPLLDIVASTSLPPSIVRSPHDIEVDVHGEAKFILTFDNLPESDLDHEREILERACKILPISKIEFLSISTHVTISSLKWSELFKRCTNVTTIQAVGRGTSCLIRDLTPPNTMKGKKTNHDSSGTSDIPVPQPIIFPNLTSLLLERVDFTETKSGSGTLYNVLAYGLRLRRSTYNVPIKKIRVDHCVIPKNQANALKKHVEDCHWDGEDGLSNIFDEFDDFGDYDSDFNHEPGVLWDDYFVGSTPAESEWWENYSDGW